MMVGIASVRLVIVVCGAYWGGGERGGVAMLYSMNFLVNTASMDRNFSMLKN
jgi:hypothetical protein